MEYFSERELGKKFLNKEEINSDVYNGILVVFKKYIKCFGKNFPVMCEDFDYVICGVNHKLLYDAIRAQIPDLDFEFNPVYNKVKDKYAILDFLEFCFKNIYDIHAYEEHKYYKHNHLQFLSLGDSRNAFREEINKIFERNQIIFYLDEDGKVKRRIPIGMQEIIKKINLETSDKKLNELITNAIDNIKKPKLENRKIGLEKIWDAFERMKTYYEDKNKKNSLEQILLEVGQDTDNFYELLNNEFKELTRIGNQYQIRHFEKDKIEIKSAKHIDYLFYRMLNSINVCVSILK